MTELGDQAYRVFCSDCNYESMNQKYIKGSILHENGKTAWRERDFTIIIEPFAHRYDTNGTPLYAGDIVLVQEELPALVAFFENDLQWKLDFLTVNVMEFSITNGIQPLANFDSDENGIIADLLIIGNIHQQKEETK